MFYSYTFSIHKHTVIDLGKGPKYTPYQSFLLSLTQKLMFLDTLSWQRNQPLVLLKLAPWTRDAPAPSITINRPPQFLYVQH